MSENEDEELTELYGENPTYLEKIEYYFSPVFFLDNYPWSRTKSQSPPFTQWYPDIPKRDSLQEKELAELQTFLDDVTWPSEKLKDIAFEIQFMVEVAQRIYKTLRDKNKYSKIRLIFVSVIYVLFQMQIAESINIGGGVYLLIAFPLIFIIGYEYLFNSSHVESVFLHHRMEIGVKTSNIENAITQLGDDNKEALLDVGKKLRKHLIETVYTGHE